MSLYTADVLVIAARHGISVHSYADDTQLYLHTPAINCEATFARLIACEDDIGLWMSFNRLELNGEKTQFTCLGAKYQLAKVDGSVKKIIINVNKRVYYEKDCKRL